MSGELVFRGGKVAGVRQPGRRLAVVLVLHQHDHLPARRVGVRHRERPLVRRLIGLVQGQDLGLGEGSMLSDVCTITYRSGLCCVASSFTSSSALRSAAGMNSVSLRIGRQG